MKKFYRDLPLQLDSTITCFITNNKIFVCPLYNSYEDTLYLECLLESNQGVISWKVPLEKQSNTLVCNVKIFFSITLANMPFDV